MCTLHITIELKVAIFNLAQIPCRPSLHAISSRFVHVQQVVASRTLTRSSLNLLTLPPSALGMPSGVIELPCCLWAVPQGRQDTVDALPMKIY